MTRDQAQCLLGVAVDATRKDVVSAHRRLISTVHPDRCSGPEAGRLAREATAARDVLLEPAEPQLRPRRPAPPAPSPPSRAEEVFDDVLLSYLRVVVERLGRPLDLAELLRTLRRELLARGMALHNARVCLARVLDAEFLLAGVARGFWELHEDGVRPVWWTEPSAPSGVAGEPDPAVRAPRAERVAGRVVFDSAAQLGGWAAARLRHRLRQAACRAAAVGVVGVYGLGAVGGSGLVLGAVAHGEPLLTLLAVPVLCVCAFAGGWMMDRFDVAPGLLGRPAVFVWGLILSAALFLLLVS